MKSGLRRSIAMTGLVAVLVSGCGSDDEDIDDRGDSKALPERYGLYALQKGELGRLNGDQSFERDTWDDRSDLNPAVRFIVFDRTLARNNAPLHEIIRLRRVARVRNEIAADGTIQPAEKNNWAVTELRDFDVSLDFKPIGNRDDMIEAIPSRPLDPGIYALQLRTGKSSVNGRLGVAWDEIDKEEYAIRFCVDRLRGEAISYKICDQQVASIRESVQPAEGSAPLPTNPVSPIESTGAPPITSGLQVRDVISQYGIIGTVPTLVIQGAIVNAGPERRRVPTLVASLRNRLGNELTSWTFLAETPYLQPGAMTGFRTDAYDPPTDTTQVVISFTR